jgi:hypothetical protein
MSEIHSDSPFTPKKTKARRKRTAHEAEIASLSDDLFSRLRTTIKETGQLGMFLYGKPSVNVTRLLLRLYNENIIRINQADSVPQLHDYKSIKMMLGVAEVDGKLYIVISEDPREDTAYAKKIHLLYTFLRNANCNVHYDEAEHLEKYVGKINTSELFPTTKITTEHQVWGGQQGNRLRSGIWDKNKQFLIAESATSYSSSLNDPLDVSFIHSLDYLLVRRLPDSETGSPTESPDTTMYPPFKRNEDDSSGKVPTGFYTCNNGSTCSESKMFSYLHTNHIFDRITGYAAFWLGNENPPKHIISGYNYSQTDQKFGEISNVVLPIVYRAIGSGQDLHHKIGNFIQLFALPCPGCFSNYSYYLGDKRIKVNVSDCIHKGRFAQHYRKSLLTTRGGKKKRRSRRAAKVTRKHNIRRKTRKYRHSGRSSQSYSSS